MIESKWLVRLMMTASAVWSAVFIARSSFVVDGQRYFALFDDAMISMRYARNLADGGGLVWNAGQPAVEGYTNFSWTLWMTVLHWLPLPDRLTPFLVSVSGAAILVVGVWLSARIAQHLVPSSPWVPVMAAAFTAACYPLAFWTLRGMEVGLVSVLASASVWLVLQLRERVTTRRAWALGALLALASVTRPDALILAVVVVPCAFLMVGRVDRKRLLWPLVAAPLAVVLAHTGFRLAYYGEVVPNTYALKVSGVSLQERLGRGFRAMAELFLKGGMLVPVVLACVAAVGAVEKRWRVSPVFTPAAVVVAFLGYSGYVGGDAWESLGFANRYVTTVLPLLFVLVAVGIHRVATRSRKLAWVVGAAAVAQLVLAHLSLPAVDALYEVRNEPGRWLFAGVGVMVIALVGFVVASSKALLSGSSGPTSIACAAVFGVGLLMSTSALPFTDWYRHGAQLAADDQATARYGLALQSHTADGTRIAVSSAGNIAYFAGDSRTFVDELGKMDPVIANMAPKRPDFPPGHQKWNYGYTFDGLRPDLIAQSFGLEETERRHLLQTGWQPLSDSAFVRADARGIDAEAIGAFLRQQAEGGGVR